MHPNPAFRTESQDRNLGFARERGFGQLSICVDDIPLAAHVPFLLSADGKTVDLHLVRSNPIARGLDGPKPALIAVSGPDSYVSPDWYGVADQVPTWNYVAVHLRGTLTPLPVETLPDLLSRQSAHFEQMLRPKTPWVTDKMSPDVLAKMMRMILPFRMEISGIDGTWKLGQNKPDTVRMAAAAQVEAHHIGQEMRLLAALMRGAGE